MTSYNDVGAGLAGTTYLRLFETLGGSSRSAILALPDAVPQLRRYLFDEGMLAARRFLAAELLHRAAPGFPDPEAAARMPAVYAEALAATEDGGPWGLPGHCQGPALEHLIQLGPAALPALRPLLGDERRVGYTGSVRATLGHVHAVRVKDLAAHAVTRILEASVAIALLPAQRDASIGRLAAMMKEVA